jgi:DHA1 family multidrug resistance protein-like MFS transporter
LYGRKISFLPAYLVFGIFLIGVATAENIQTVMLCRFFAGLMASAPISNVAGSLADMYDDKSRGLAVVLYSVAVIGGPTVGKCTKIRDMIEQNSHGL